MANEDIKKYARMHDVRLWQIAQRLNLYDGNFSRLLRKELTEDKKKQIIGIIDELAASSTPQVSNLLDYFNEMNEQEQQMLLSSAEQILLKRKESEG